MDHTAYIGVGANLGDPLAQCRHAIDALAELPMTRVAACSSFYKNPPLVAPGMDASGVPPYVNAVCELKTGLKPQALLERLQALEKAMGRVRHAKWESRLIDLDFLAYDALSVRSAELILPHPELPNRAFVLVPLAEIAPDWAHPSLGKTARALLTRLPNTGELTKCGPSRWS